MPNMAAKRTGRCAFCGQTFTAERRAGPAPRYCSQAHRQRAYEQRRRATRGDAEHDLTQQVRTLQARVNGLERENRELRRDRDEAIEEIARLQQQLRPLSPTLQRLTSPEPTGPTAESPPPRRRWNLSR
jgi:septal ring factor EnvC (AmiA/AmiB activator)